MKTFYSILSVIINSVSGEKISIGLLLADGNRSLFDFSENRLSLLNSLLERNTKSKKHTFIDVSELEIIEEYAKTHQVKPAE